MPTEIEDVSLSFFSWQNAVVCYNWISEAEKKVIRLYYCHSNCAVKQEKSSNVGKHQNIIALMFICMWMCTFNVVGLITSIKNLCAQGSRNVCFMIYIFAIINDEHKNCHTSCLNILHSSLIMDIKATPFKRPKLIYSSV